jgi:hypothetical protein
MQTMWNSLVGTVSNKTFCTKSKFYINQGNILKRKKIPYLAILVYDIKKVRAGMFQNTAGAPLS